ncbi:MAG: hypothetical protein Q8L07_11870 [Sediminibacterium sp.]|nr:hypothetical protein [Sediminibacterium sp.]
MKFELLLVLIILPFFASVVAQDKIIKKNDSTILCKIKEVGTDEIKYLQWDDLAGPLFSIERIQVKGILFESGKEQKNISKMDPLRNPENYIGQSTRAVKFDFMAPLLGFSHFTYEKSTGIGKSYELSIGIIGLGKNILLDNYYYGSNSVSAKKNQVGLFLGVGYKFNKLPNFIFGRSRFTHIMQGSYVKPIFYIGDYSENGLLGDTNGRYQNKRSNIFFGALQLELGKQWVFVDQFLIDSFWGLGYGFDNKSRSGNYYTDNSSSAYNYANSRLGKSPAFSLSFGLRFGVLLKEKK